MGFDEELDDGLTHALELLESMRERRFFLFFHTYEVHNPFRSRQPFLSQLSDRSTSLRVDVARQPRHPEDGFLEHRTLVLKGATPSVDLTQEQIRALALDLYDSQIAYADAALGRLFEALDRLELTARTIVIVTSDHGELFGEHDLANHVSLYDENILVPLVIALPDGSYAGIRIGEQVRSIDITPTILDLLAVRSPADLDGSSLVPLLEGRRRSENADMAVTYASSSNRGLGVRQGNRLKYVFRNSAWRSREPSERFFDLTRDPHELEPAAGVPAEFEEIRRFGRNLAAQKIAGLRVRFANLDGQEPLMGRLHNPSVGSSRIKALTPDDAVLTRVDGRTAEFAIPPGSSATINIEHVEGEVDIEILGSETAGLSSSWLRVDPSSLTGVVALRRARTGYQIEHSEGLEGDGVFVWSQGDLAVDAAEIDDDLSQQLRALGYLDE